VHKSADKNAPKDAGAVQKEVEEVAGWPAKKASEDQKQAENNAAKRKLNIKEITVSITL
jgi:hypothetical protein